LGELYLPKAARTLRLCILHGENPVTSRRLGSLLANDETAVLTLRTDAAVSARELSGIVDWIRSRRLLQRLAIRMIAAPPDPRPAAVSA
jgi:hypothetical protein